MEEAGPRLSEWGTMPWNQHYDSMLYTTEVISNFLVKFPIFRYHGNRGRLSKVRLTPLNWPIPKTP